MADALDGHSDSIVKMKKVLITGSNGFVGKNILNELLPNHKIYVTVRKKFYWMVGLECYYTKCSLFFKLLVLKITMILLGHD